jgi:quercetin dioxygenase-like cupin family protein
MMNNGEIKKLIPHVITEEIQYVPNSIVNIAIINKPTGSIMLMSFDTGTEYKEHVLPFDSYFMIIEGTAEIVMNDELNKLKKGEGIIIPAQQRKSIIATEPFKMIVAFIKSGYL